MTHIFIDPCRRDSSGEIIEPFSRPIIVSKSASVDSKVDNDNLLDLIPPTISDRTKQVPQLESWKSLEIRTNEGDNDGTAGSDNDKTVVTEDITDLSDYYSPIQKTLQIINDNDQTDNLEDSLTDVKHDDADDDEGEETDLTGVRRKADTRHGHSSSVAQVKGRPGLSIQWK